MSSWLLPLQPRAQCTRRPARSQLCSPTCLIQWLMALSQTWQDQAVILLDLQIMSPRWLELLKQVAPGVARVGFIFDPTNPTVAAYQAEMEAVSSSFGVRVLGVAVHNEVEIERAIEAFAREPDGGLIVPSGPATTSFLPLLIAAAVRHRLPSVHPIREAVVAGALASYGVDTNDLFRSAATYVDRILKGEPAGDLPVQFATKFELVVNLKTARALGLDHLNQLLARTDELIE